jgi:hypothetical protein
MRKLSDSTGTLEVPGPSGWRRDDDPFTRPVMLKDDLGKRF